jgi:outer membrane protein OmpA-like peptidoglycan-associated protein
MTKKLLLVIFLYPVFFSASAQKSKVAIKRLPISADCKNAIKISSVKKGNYGPTAAPKGFGKLKEITACDKQDIFSFEKEHNSAWYYFVVPEDGDAIVEITSINPKDDYDFMIYKYTDSCFCDNVMLDYLLPVRTNLSRVGKGGVQMTGLAYNALRDHVPVGEGEPFSTSLPVKQGEKYFLAVDNVKPQGEGHIIKLYYLKEISISGAISDDSKQSIKGNVRIENKEGKIISSVPCDENGKYSINAKIKDDEYYTLIYSADSFFTECRQIFITDFSKTNYQQRELQTTLKKLERGKKFQLTGINFAKNSAKLLPTSYSSLNSLCEILKEDTLLNIQIEGHVNNPVNPSNTGADKKLGLDKATSIYDYLLSRGIKKERMAAVSYGSLFMIYSKPSTPEQTEANNRVEIFFLPKK